MTRRKDGLWQEAVVIGKTRKYFYGKTKSDVYRKIAAYKEKSKHAASFRSVAEKWWEQHEPSLAYSTARSYKPAYLRAVKAFDSAEVSTITSVDIQREINAFARQNMADKTVRTQLMIYNLIFRFAVTEGLISVNPAREVTVPKNLKKSKRTIPSDEDLAKVKSSVGCTFGLFAFMALYTGLRQGELLALTWDDVDLRNRCITVDKSLEHRSNRPFLKSTKTASSVRVVPIPDKLMCHLHPGCGLVFPNSAGDYLSNTQRQSLWKQYCRESGVTCTLHQLRHAYATMLLEAGIGEKDAQDLLGHAQLSTTMDIYTDIRKQRRAYTHKKILSLDLNTDRF